MAPGASDEDYYLGRVGPSDSQPVAPVADPTPESIR
jgi:hypothetical protein